MKEDALWRATPRGVWELVLTELFLGMDNQIPEAPAATRKTPSATGTWRRYTDEKPEQGTKIEPMTVPDLSWYYDEEPLDEDRYRTGGKRSAPAVKLPMPTSFQDRWSGEAADRLVERDTEVWRINSDSAKKVANEKITGNRPLPTDRWNYHVMMRQVVEWYQRMRRGGLTCRNWLRLECAAENWDTAAEVARSNGADSVVECRPVSNPSEGKLEGPTEDDNNTRRGAQTIQQKEAFKVSTGTRTTQDQYDAKMRYAKTTHKIEISTKSLSDGTRAGHRGSWIQWAHFLHGQGQPGRLGSREESWGEHLMNFILGEHGVLGLKAATIRGKVSGIRFFISSVGRATSPK